VVGPEDDPVAKEEVEDAGCGDRREIGDDVVQAEPADEDRHQHQAARHRDDPVAGVERDEPSPRRSLHSAFCILHSAFFISSRPVPPGPPFVPQEVVQHRQLDREGGRGKVVQAQAGHQQRQRGELHRDSHRADNVEAKEAEEHGRLR